MKLCQTCSKELYVYNQSGYCRKCWNSAPEKRARTSAKMKRNWQDPSLRETYREAGIKNLNLPGVRERAVASVKANKTWEVAAQHITEQARKRGVSRWYETMMPDIPREYRDEYRRLRRSKRLPKEEAIEVIRQQHSADLQRLRRRLLGSGYGTT